MSKQKRISYKIPLKLEVVKYTKEHGNRAAERHFGPPPTEKMIREWRKQEDQLQKTDKTKQCFRGHAAKWPHLEVDMKEWITRHRNNGFQCLQKRSSMKPNVSLQRKALRMSLDHCHGATDLWRNVALLCAPD